MKNRQLIQAVDVHAAGEPGRVLIGSGLRVKGATMAEKLRYCEEHLDDFRNLILHEPRGYPGLCSPIVVPATDPSCDFGMIVMEQGGFKPMSGLNLICTVTALIETGSVDVSEPVAPELAGLDTAAGIVTVRAEVEAGRATSVTFDNVARHSSTDSTCRSKFLGVWDDPRRHRTRGSVLRADCGGQPRRGPCSGQCRGDYQSGQRDAAGGERDLRGEASPHPGDRRDRSAADPRARPHSGHRRTRMRSSCPTASSTSTIRGRGRGRSTVRPAAPARAGQVAAKHARGELAVGQRSVHESMLGTTFTAVVKEETEICGLPAVIPSITGRGWITGFQQLVLEPDDPFPIGFTVGDISGAAARARRNRQKRTENPQTRTEERTRIRRADDRSNDSLLGKGSGRRRHDRPHMRSTQ